MLNNGIAGMSAASMSLNVTSKNIANASVLGYSRQKAFYTTEDNGSVSVETIERISDRFYTGQLQDAATNLGYAATLSNQMTKMEEAVSAKGMTLSPSLNTFFKSLNAAQADPMDPAFRQQVLSDAGDLAARFNGLSDRMNDQLNDTHEQLRTMTGEANAVLKQVARLNTDIAKQNAAGKVSPELLDERDIAVRKLSEMVGVDVSFNENNTVGLFTSSGEPLVVSNKANELTLMPGNPDKDMVRIGLKSGDSEKLLRTVGGALEAHLDFRDKTLLPAREALNEQALALATAFNDQQAVGFDLNDDAGKPLFDIGPNDAAATLKVAITDTRQLAFASEKGKPGNNENLIKLTDIQDRKLVGPTGSKKTLSGAYKALVVNTASKTSAAKAGFEASSKIHQTANSKLLGVAGVNLDEEAAQMVVFQQAYNANAKVISATNEMLNTLLRL
ncbi:flagellar hook-associated protein FlgK [Endozoicomonas sp. OPT23]|uniref:flagellar hook-associated protein FlgK n=1 Tax=Endozoicomonas sp. OPT23 TaxID=2072845 RepID=UPI001891A97E|nr:flagellar hook-associated protein FlgK [Endozoicomonas sp. OPT23]